MSQKRNCATNTAVLCLCFIVGVISVRFVPALWSPLVTATTGCACLVTAYRFARFRWFLVAAFGLCWAAFTATSIQSNTLPENFEKRDLVAEGRISGIVSPTRNGYRFEFSLSSLRMNNRQIPINGKLKLNTYSREIVPASGEIWRFTVRLKRPHGMQNPGATLNYETWLFFKRIIATGYIVNGQWLKISGNPKAGPHFSGSVDQLRQEFAAYLDHHVQSRVSAGLLAALTVGVRTTMENEQWQVLQNTGTIHLVAISGLHIGLVSIMSIFLFGWGWRRSSLLCHFFPARAAAMLAGCMTGFVYALMAGFTLPTRRALIMLIAIVLVMLLQRNAKTGLFLILSMTVVLLVDPLGPLSSSFWLSFGAVSILLFISTFCSIPDAAKTTNVSRIYQYFSKWTAVQIWLFLGMMPMVLIGFQRVSLSAPLANLIAVPVIGFFVVPVALTALLLWSVNLEWIAAVCIDACDWVLTLLWQYLTWIAQQPWASWAPGQPHSSTAWLGFLGFLILFAGRAFPMRWLGIVWMLPMLLPLERPPQLGAFKYSMLDVGQGLASVVQTANHVLVYDTGANYSGGFNLGRIVLIPFLRQIGVDDVDMLVVSHGDNDHIGGAKVLTTELNVRHTISSVSEQLVDAQSCEAGQEWRWDGVQFEVLWPYSNSATSGNNASCVIKVSSIHGSLLLTGDIELQTEARLVRLDTERLHADVLQVPHHGSKTSSSKSLLQTVSPRLALVSAGYRNRFRHPSNKVVARYNNSDIPLLNTATEGALEILFADNIVSVSTQRSRATHFWQAPGTVDIESLNQQLLNAGNPMVQLVKPSFVKK